MNSSNPLSAAPEHPTLSTHWLDGIQGRDEVQWKRLVDIFGPIVYRWCRTSGVREGDAPDVVQNVFMAVARGVASFERHKASGSFRSWLATITRNKVRDYFRSAARSIDAEGGSSAVGRLAELEEKLDSTICAESSRTPLAKQLLRQVEAEFEPLTWRAFWLMVIESRRAAEVAELTGLSLASVYQAKSRVLRRLRQRVEDCS